MIQIEWAFKVSVNLTWHVAFSRCFKCCLPSKTMVISAIDTVGQQHSNRPRYPSLQTRHRSEGQGHRPYMDFWHSGAQRCKSRWETKGKDSDVSGSGMGVEETVGHISKCDDCCSSWNSGEHRRISKNAGDRGERSGESTILCSAWISNNTQKGIACFRLGVLTRHQLSPAITLRESTLAIIDWERQETSTWKFTCLFCVLSLLRSL